MEKCFTIGRGLQNNIVVSATYTKVSTKHATIRVDGKDVIFEDHSTNGSTVNGHRVHHSRFYLQKGDDVILANSYRLNLSFLPLNNDYALICASLSRQTPFRETSRKVNVGHGDLYNASIEASLPYVYFIEEKKRVAYFRGEKYELEGGGTATGFMLSDGKFVTARHVVEPWMFITQGTSEEQLTLNRVATLGGRVVSYMTAYNCKGDKFSFSTENAVIYREHDRIVEFEDNEYTLASLEQDWAYLNMRKHDGLPFDAPKSICLKMLTKLTILGFPFGFGANAADDIQPIYGSATVAKTGLDNGVILTTEDSTDPGNSGGPAFYSHADGSLSVVGIVSAGRGAHLGMMVPIYNIFAKRK